MRTVLRTTIVRWAALALASMLALAACAGADHASTTEEPAAAQQNQGGDASPGTSAPATGEGDASAGADSGSGQGASDGSSKQDAAPAPSSGVHVARSAQLSMQVKDVDRAVAKVRSSASTAGGYVSSEETHLVPEDGDEGGPRAGGVPVPGEPSWSEIVVTVPVDDLQSTIDELSRIGKVTGRSQDSEDLTSQYTDTASRVKTMRASVSRLQQLIADTDDLDQIITLEDELAEREADLESLTSQKKALEKRTTTAPITVSVTERVPEDAPEAGDEDGGFLAGLAGGWEAFTVLLHGGLTALGAVTPFAVTALLLSAPIVWWVRRRRTMAEATEDDG